MHNIDGNQAIKSASIGDIESKVLNANSNESKSGKILTNFYETMAIKQNNLHSLQGSQSGEIP
jgi:hypothetical protein